MSMGIGPLVQLTIKHRIAMKYLMDNEMVEYLMENATNEPPIGKLGSLYELRSEKFIDEGSYGHFEMVIREYNPAYPDNSQYEPILLILPHDIHGGHPDAMNISESLAENHSIEDCYNV